jgi:Methyltransferase domain
MNRMARKIFDLALNSSNPRSLAYRFRRRRLQLILEAIHPTPDRLVLDIGSHGGFFRDHWPYPDRVIGLDLIWRPELAGRPGGAVIADARALPFRDQSVVILCNSVLEHVGSLEEQRKAAEEIARVGQRYFVQIPYRFFPIDPHYFTVPFFQLLPESLQRAICRRSSVGYIRRGEYLELHYLSARQLAALFPAARILRERYFGLTKSLYAVGGR